MHWYGGSIAEAVSLSKQRNAIFVVFVEGDNDLSTEMAATIDDTVVVSRLSDQANFLAVKLKSGSTNYTHFAQIYQFVPVPSLFFIGRNGTPLEVVCAGVQASNLASRIDRILEEHRKDKSGGVQPSTSSQNIKEQTVNLLQSEVTANVEQTHRPSELGPPKAETPAPPAQLAQPAQKTPDKEYEVVCDGDVCVRRLRDPGPSHTKDEDQPSPSNVSPAQNLSDAINQEKAADTTKNTEPEPAESSSSASVEEKLERAKVLIDARRREKDEKEKEAEKQKEMERRATGKGVSELKKWQAEQELKQIQEERKREKLENNLARQRILEQIAQDRAERRARDAVPVEQAQTEVHPAPTSGDVGSQARIQFKLPDGSSHTAQFHADDTLNHLHRYVADNLQLSTSSFSLWTAFPRRELTDPEATLRGLQLAPSAALLVLPRRTATTVSRPSTFATILTFFSQLFTSLILEPSQQLYTWIRSRLFPPVPPRDPSTSNPNPNPNPNPQRTPPGLRRRGNIHRLPGDRGEDDDNNTWNGNSTQQM